MKIAALSFDLWDTLVADDSDEPLRAARGWPAKPAAREALYVAATASVAPGRSEAARAAWALSLDWFRREWKVHHRTPPLRARIAVANRALGVSALPDEHALVRALAEMEVALPPAPAPGVHAALERLAGRYPLGIVSDAIVTPGHDLRRLLAHHGLLGYFRAFVFSDEAGFSKPDPRAFHRVARGLGVPVAQLVHVGDRESNDVAGPHAAGARAVLYTGVVDRGGARSAADWVAPSLTALADLFC